MDEQVNAVRQLDADRSRPTTWIVAVLVALLAAAAGAMTGRLVTRDEPAPRPAPVAETRSLGALTFAVPEGWTRLARPPALPGTTPRASLGFRGPLSDVVITQQPIETASLLPRELQRSVASGRAAELAEVAGRRALLYRDIEGIVPHSIVDVYALPTSAGVALIGCISDAAFRVQSEDCELAAEQLRVAGAQAFDAKPGIAVSLRLAQIVAGLDRARRDARAQLAKTRTPGPRKRAALHAAAIYDESASSLAPLAGTAADRALERLLRDTADAYRALARAEGARDVAGSLAAAAAIDARESALQRSLAQRPVPGPAENQ